MTSEEAINVLLENVPKCCKMVDGRYQGGFDDWDCDMGQAIRVAVLALQDVRNYQKIGTVEECREAVEKQKPKKCDVTKDNFRIYYKCPTCNHCLRVEYNHGSWMGKKSKNCSKCGQAIQWEESEEE